MPDTPPPTPVPDEPADDASSPDEPGQAPAGSATDQRLFEEVLRSEPRRRRGIARKRGRSLSEDGAVPAGSEPETAAVRTDMDEDASHDEEVEAPPQLLGADGEPIAGPRSGDASAPASAGTSSSDQTSSAAPDAPAAARNERPSATGAPGAESASFLALAVRSYLDGIDRLGPDSEVTVDRLARLRETLRLYDAMG